MNQLVPVFVARNFREYVEKVMPFFRLPADQKIRQLSSGGQDYYIGNEDNGDTISCIMASQRLSGLNVMQFNQCDVILHQECGEDMVDLTPLLTAWEGYLNSRGTDWELSQNPEAVESIREIEQLLSEYLLTAMNVKSFKSNVWITFNQEKKHVIVLHAILEEEGLFWDIRWTTPVLIYQPVAKKDMEEIDGITRIVFQLAQDTEKLRGPEHLYPLLAMFPDAWRDYRKEWVDLLRMSQHNAYALHDQLIEKHYPFGVRATPLRTTNLPEHSLKAIRACHHTTAFLLR